MSGPAALFAILLSFLVAGPAHGGSSWLRPFGAGEFEWGTNSQPFDVVPRPQDFYLPDSGYIGVNASDRPDDLELKGPHPMGERRFVRYVRGELVDAWMVRDGPIDTGEFTAIGDEEWAGAVLGPADEGYRAIGDAVSWKVNGRTVMHWKDRNGTREVLVSRAVPTGHYGVRRAAPLERDREGSAKAQIRGDLKALVKPHASYLSGCLDQAPMPVEGKIDLVFDKHGRLARVRGTTDQPSFDVVECWAGALILATADADTRGSITLYRLR